MKGTWEKLYKKGHRKIRWPGWPGFIAIRKTGSGDWAYTSHDASGKREGSGQQNYIQFADSPEWESVE